MNENLDLMKKPAAQEIEIDSAIETFGDLQKELDGLHLEKAQKEQELEQLKAELKDDIFNLQEKIISTATPGNMQDELDTLHAKKEQKENELQELKNKIFNLQEKIISTQN